MKIAVISDVHGNKLALDAVLEDIKEKECDMLLCLGDIAMAGYDPNYTVSTLKFLQSENSPLKTEIIAGNTDIMLLNYSETLFNKVLEFAPCMAYSMQEDLKILEKENLDFLKTLKINKNLTIDGVKIFMCHGSPIKIDERILPETDVKHLDDMCKKIDADIILCGHTHVPCGFQLDCGKTLMNVGSVGRPMTFDKSATYAILDTQGDDMEYSVAHHIVKFDNKKVKEFILVRNFKDCETLANMFEEQ